MYISNKLLYTPKLYNSDDFFMGSVFWGDMVHSIVLHPSYVIPLFPIISKII